MQDIFFNIFFPVLLKQEREIGNSKRSNSRRDGGITAGREVSHSEVKILNGLPC